MNALVTSAAPVQAMSSREIADLCEKRHDHVMRDIRQILVELHGEGCLPKFGGTSTVQQPNGGEREIRAEEGGRA